MYDEVKTLRAEIQAKEQNMQSLVKRAEASAEASAIKASQAEVFLNEANETYRKTLALSLQVQENLSQMRSMLQEARDYAHASAESAGQASDSLNRSYLMNNETRFVLSRSAAIYNNMTLLARQIVCV
jgi:hypothetical protein